MGCLLLCMILCLLGCKQAPQQRVTIEQMDIVALLELTELESFLLYEYAGDTLQFLIYEKPHVVYSLDDPQGPTIWIVSIQ